MNLVIEALSIITASMLPNVDVRTGPHMAVAKRIAERATCCRTELLETKAAATERGLLHTPLPLGSLRVCCAHLRSLSVYRTDSEYVRTLTCSAS